MSFFMKKVILSAHGSKRIKDGHLWVFKSDVKDLLQAKAGDLVQILDAGQNVFGCGFVSQSELALRLITKEKEILNERVFFTHHLKQIIERKRRLFKTRDSLRLIHGEGDGMPGLLVDCYHDALVIQTLTQGTDQRKSMFVEILKELINPRAIVIRDDGMTRDYESLKDEKYLAYGDHAQVAYKEGEITFQIDLLGDQKTGGFLDQYENHLIAKTYAFGHALDTFCYHGGFGLQMAQVCEQVLCVDQSQAAIEKTQANASFNHIKNLKTECVNAFDFFKKAYHSQLKFDTIVVDPPAFAKRKSALQAALKGYKELNLRAMQMLRPGGILISCSCSAKVTQTLFEDMLHKAAQDAKRHLIILERRGASRDHSVLLGMRETEYLKCFVMQIL